MRRNTRIAIKALITLLHLYIYGFTSFSPYPGNGGLQAKTALIKEKNQAIRAIQKGFRLCF